MEDRTPLEAIHHLLPEMRDVDTKVKTLRDQLKDLVASNDEYQKLQEEIKELSNKRAQAKKLLLDDQDYQKISADLDDYRLKSKDLAEILSHYLVSYYRETNETKISDDTGETRSLILNAKIGKAEAS